MARGIFITFEGGEGAGKTTQVRKLSETLIAKGIDVIATREPGGTPQAERIRSLVVDRAAGPWEALTEAFLFSAARHEHVEHRIRPALAAGKWVICDRFADSTRAMQGAGMNLDSAVVEHLCNLATGGLNPDLTVIFDLDPAVGLARAAARQGVQTVAEDRYERMSQDFHHRLRQGFLQIAANHPDRCVVIDAAQSLEVVHAEILHHVLRRCPIAQAAHG